MIDVSLQQDHYGGLAAALVQPSLVNVLKARVTQDFRSQPVRLRPSAVSTSPSFPVDTLSVSQKLADRLNSVAQLEAMEQVDKEGSDNFEAGNAFYVADLGEVYRQHMRWKALLPRIEPFFAVKCNPDPMVLRLLASLGTGFDCASKGEIEAVMGLDAAFDPYRIIYANPCKQASFVRYAHAQGVRMMTFDNAEELYKIKRNHSDAQLVLRILTDDSKSLCKLGLKFGAPLDTTANLFMTARELGLDVVGVSFHVGSGCFDANAFGEAVIRARRVFDQAKEYGYELDLLDVGGGFPSAHVTEGITFEKVAAILGPTVDTLFPRNVRVIAEPGRFYVGSAYTLATQVIARRTIAADALAAATAVSGNEVPAHMYYINDGMYGSFNCIMFDHQACQPKVLLRDGEYVFGPQGGQGKTRAEKASWASVWGPTCDSIDCVSPKVRLPLLEAGDWMYFENMGAYTITAASQFNGFRKSEVVYTTLERQ
ncbi:hypothetical protein BGW38_006389, partial [Lunasporangiospora selenospora]